jgi:hypothetical protein
MKLNTNMFVKLLALFVILLALCIPEVYASDILTPDWNRITCAEKITHRLTYGLPIPPEYWARAQPTSVSNSTDYELTLLGCHALRRDGNPQHGTSTTEFVCLRGCFLYY